MLFTRLTQNFSFLEQDEYKTKPEWKEKIIENISKAEKLDDPADNINQIWKACELILNGFINEFDPNYDFISKFSEKIEFIQNHPYICLDQYVKYYLHQINKKRNAIEHGHNNKFSLNLNTSDVIYNLHGLYVIAKNLVLKNDFEDNFNEKFYLKNNDTNQTINAISDKQNKEDTKYFNTNDFKINENIIISWMSIKNAKLVVPIYQRKYEWNTDNIKTLFDDIKLRWNDGEEHYFGTIAHKKTSDSNINSKQQIKIIDGQQRLTTSFVLISAARDFLINKGYYSNWNDIPWYKEITSKLDLVKLGDYIHNPGGTNENNESFRAILNGEEHTNKSTNYKKNYDEFYQHLSSDKDLNYKFT